MSVSTKPPAGDPVTLNAWDRVLAYFSAGAGVKRLAQRRTLAAMEGYEAANPTRRRRFALNQQSGDTLSRRAAGPLRNQARDLERNHDLVTGTIDKLVDFTIGPNGVQVEAQPRRRDGSIHTELAQRLMRNWARWSEWPEVTWTHDRGSMERLLMASAVRDGEAFAQLVEGPRSDQAHAGPIPFSLELMEADLLPHDLDDEARRIRQGIERNTWNRPVAYHVYRSHPGDDATLLDSRNTKRIPAERITHLRFVRRIGQLRGISLLAPVLDRIRDIKEYEDSERMAAKMAADYVFKWTRGAPDQWEGEYDPNNLTAPPIFKMDGGMVVASGPGEGLEPVDTKRPNANAEPFVNGQLRRYAAGVGLSYSAVSRNYDGTYSAQRQELVENWPHYHALTGIFIAHHQRHVWQRFVAWELLTYGIPAEVDMDTVSDALFLGPPMPWIDPMKEAEANVLLVQACFKSSAQVVRERGGSLTDTYAQLAAEVTARKDAGITSVVDNATAIAARPDPAPAPAPATNRSAGRVVPLHKDSA